MFPLSPDAHNSLESAATSKLGAIHWHLLRASRLLGERAIEEIPVADSTLRRTQQTAFGREVGFDEIHWWVFKKEPDLLELRARTEQALQAAELLKESSKKLKDLQCETYEQLVEGFRRFADDHSDQIDILHEYVESCPMRQAVGGTAC